MRRWAAIAVALALGLAPLPALATAGETTTDDNILVEVRVDQLILSDALGARAAPTGGLRLPLGEFAQALGIAIKVDAAAGTAQGFVLHEDRKFSLDLAKGLVLLGGNQLPFDAALVERRSDDIYVDMRLLARWFPIGLTYDPFALLVRVNPLEPLPAQARLERERRNEQNGDAPANPKYPFVATPYALFGDPSIDPTFGLTLGRDDAGHPLPVLSYGALLDSDLLGVNASGYLTGSTLVPITDWHLTLGRKDPDGGLLGPLRARDASAGYIFDPGLPLISGAWNGYGALVSSYPLGQDAHFDKQSLHGPLPAGWDAQLFQNNFPIAYQPAGSTGEYRFDDVPLVVGPNEFRIVLNGPQGQRREEVRRVNIGATLTPPGERRYRVLSGLDANGRNHTTAQVEQGFSGQLSGAAGVASLTPLGGGPARQYGQVGLRGTVGEVFWHADGVAATDGGLGTEVGAQAAAGPLGLSLSQAVLKDYLSDEFRVADDPVMARSTGRLDARTPDEFWMPASLALTSQVDRHVSGLWEPTVGNQLSARLGAFTATNALTWDLNANGPFSDATFELGSRVGEVDVRGQLGYTPTALSVLTMIGQGQLWNQTRWTLAGSYQLALQQPQVQVELNRNFDQLTAGFTVAVVYPWQVTGGVNLSAGLGLLTGGLLASGNSQATTGTAAVQVFLDANRNGKMDPGERAMPNIVLEIAGQTLTTDARGRANAHGLAAYVPVDADFSKIALDDPLLVPAIKGARFVPRPGRATQIALPIVAVGEVYGTVRVNDHGHLREQAGAAVELVDAQGRVVVSGVAGLDGYFALTGVPPGTYQLRVPADQLQKLNMRPVTARAVTVPGEGAVLDGQDFTLLPI